MNKKDLRNFLNLKVVEYNQPAFIPDDPISIPHRFKRKQDIEIAGFFAAILAWGNRKSIINSCNRLLAMMDNEPYHFVMNADWQEPGETAAVFTGFVHRTFNDLDLLHLLNFLRHHYRNRGEESLETAFTEWMQPGDTTVENALAGFHQYVFDYCEDARLEHHCRKHIATPAKKSACKRLNMYLRWMVRKDLQGVDFGIWKNIALAQLICPMDVHVARVAKRLNLLTRNQTDWLSAQELTAYLRKLDAKDPVKYDFALFGLGVVEHY